MNSYEKLAHEAVRSAITTVSGIPLQHQRRSVILSHLEAALAALINQTDNSKKLNGLLLLTSSVFSIPASLILARDRHPPVADARSAFCHAALNAGLHPTDIGAFLSRERSSVASAGRSAASYASINRAFADKLNKLLLSIPEISESTGEKSVDLLESPSASIQPDASASPSVI